ncbi:MAG: hypothetical protein IPM56_11080 [Ignavibacteriales bacterium]|nr:MAG: hypothetical protein IPM56_11080 [Ignavibacteriales bacterium]
MKVYESSIAKNIGDFKKVPEIKIKNIKLLNSGFEIGKEYQVIYEEGKIILVLVVTHQEVK